MPEGQAEMIRQIIQFNLTGRQIRDICKQQEEEIEDAEESISADMCRMARLIRTVERKNPEDVAHAVLHEEKNVHLARARLQTMITLVQDALKYLPEE